LRNVNIENSEIDIEKLESYYEQGNWGYPIVAINRSREYITGDRYYSLMTKCMEKRSQAIVDAKNSYDLREKLIDYNNLILKTRNPYMDEDNKLKFKKIVSDADKLIKILNRAIKLFPEKIEARWGLATVYNYNNEHDKSAKVYKKLIEDFPENNRLQYEYALTLLSIDKEEGFDELSQIMSKTDEFDHLLKGLGDMYLKQNQKDKAIQCYKNYLMKYPINGEVEDKLKGLLENEQVSIQETDYAGKA